MNSNLLFPGPHCSPRLCYYSGFSPAFLRTIISSYKLFDRPLRDLCHKAASIQVKKCMYTPESGEYVHKEDTLEVAVHLAVIFLATEAIPIGLTGILMPLLAHFLGLLPKQMIGETFAGDAPLQRFDSRTTGHEGRNQAHGPYEVYRIGHPGHTHSHSLIVDIRGARPGSGGPALLALLFPVVFRVTE